MSNFTINDDLPDDEPAEPKRRNRAFLAGLLDQVELWTDRRGQAYATIQRDGRRESHAVASRGFRHWLTWQVYRETDSALSAAGLGDAVRLAEARAVAEGVRHVTWRRWGMHDGAIYLDLGCPAWRAVEIKPTGWSIVPAAPCRFVRPPDCLPMPEPEAGAAQWGDLARIIPCANDEAAILNWAWLLAAARPFEDEGAYPILVFHGPQGSGKSDATKRIAGILDPTETGVRAFPREERDLIVAAAGRHLLAFDNVSTITPAWSDVICRLSSGAAFGARTLHSDADESLFKALRPVCVNGIPSAFGRPDAAERTLSIELATLGSRRRTDDDLEREYRALLPGILGLLCDGLAAALARYASTHVAELPRMAAACRWAEAGAFGLGIEPGRIPAAWRANRAAADTDAVEADEVACAVRALLDARESFKGSATELATELAGVVPERTLKGAFWPKTAAAMGNHLKRIAPALRSAWAIEAESGKGGEKSSRWWSLRRL